MNHNRTRQADRKAREIFRAYHFKYPENLTEKERNQFLTSPECVVGYYRKTKKPCSCAACGNPRKHFGEITMQEKISKINFDEQSEECGL